MPAARSTSWYGWRPDAPDARDHLYASIARPPKRLPARVDLRRWSPPIQYQGSIGSCTAHALLASFGYLERRAGLRPRRLSRLFLYYNARVLEGTAATDDGAMIRNGVKTLRKQGVCPETLWPYRVRRFAEQPPPPCYTAAIDHHVISYHRIHGLEEMRQCLAEGFPFVFGLTTYESFEGPQVARTGRVELPKRGEEDRGGHSVCVVGYDDRARRFLVRNSWGADWGRAGHFTLPYDYATNPRRAGDFWTLRAVELA